MLFTCDAPTVLAEEYNVTFANEFQRFTLPPKAARSDIVEIQDMPRNRPETK